MIKTIVLILFLIMVAGCSSPTSSPITPKGDTTLAYSGINLDLLDTSEATFFLQFDGEKPWVYKLDFRSDGEVTERILHIEGVESAQNPGDVRILTQGGSNYMKGPGTDGECLIFSTSLDLGPAFLLPDHLITPAELNPALQYLGEDLVEGIQSTRLGLRSEELTGWSDVLIDIWTAEQSGTILRYDLQLTGQDPFFGHGAGRLSGQFIVQSLAPASIEPITGCDIELPIPESAENLVKLPGLLAFDSVGSLEIAAAFYQEGLPQSGWTQSEEPAQAGDVLILSYEKDGGRLEIVIERLDDNVHVDLLTD